MARNNRFRRKDWSKEWKDPIKIDRFLFFIMLNMFSLKRRINLEYERAKNRLC